MGQLDQNSGLDLKVQELEDQIQTMTTVIEKLVLKMQTGETLSPPMHMDLEIQEIQDEELNQESVSIAQTQKHLSTVQMHQFYQASLNENPFIRSNTQLKRASESIVKTSDMKDGSSTHGGRPRRILLKDRYESRISQKQLNFKHTE